MLCFVACSCSQVYCGRPTYVLFLSPATHHLKCLLHVSCLRCTGWLENSELRARLLQLQPVKAAAAAAAAAHGSTQQPQQQQPPLLLAFAQPHEHQAVSSWLESVKEATGGAATLERVVIVWQQQEQQRQHQQQQKPDTEGSAAAAAGAGTAALPEVEAAGLSLLEFTSSVAAAQHPDWSSGQNSSSSSSHNR